MAKLELLSKDRDKLFITVDGFTIEKINELLSTRDFNSVSSLVRTAILYLYKDYEVKGKLSRKPPIKAEERIENATYTGSKEVEVD
jgi:Arc/MetJ-type ribon-helix-helix transcriptional regulator